MNSTSSSAQNMSRSHVTPELSVIVGRSGARWIVTPIPPRLPTLHQRPLQSPGVARAPRDRHRRERHRRHTELRRKGVESSNRRLTCLFDLRNRTRRQIEPTASSRSPTPWRNRIARSRAPSSNGALGTSLSDLTVQSWEEFPIHLVSLFDAWHRRRPATDLAVDDCRGNDKETLEDVLPLYPG